MRFGTTPTIGATEAQSLDLTGTLISLRHTHVERLLYTPSGASADADILEFFTAPSTLAHQLKLSDTVGLGYGIFTTARESGFAQTSLDTTPEELDEWHLAVIRDLQRYHAGIGLSFRVRDDLRIGAAFFGVYESDVATQQLSGGGTTGAGGAVTVIQQSWRSSVGAQASLAFLADPAPGWFFGVTAYTPLVLFGSRLDRLESVDVTLDDGSGTPVRERATNSESGIAGDVALSTPARFRAALARRFGRLLVSLDGDIQAPLDQPDLDIQRETVPNFRVGADWAYSEKLSLGAGLFTDLAAERQASTVVDFGGFTVGAGTRTRHRLAPGEPAEALVFKGFFAFRYALGIGNTDALAIQTDPGAEGIVGGGRSRTVVHEFGVNVGTGLEF